MEERSILVAGGGSGMGRATVRALSEQGCRILCACRDPQSLPEVPNVTAARFDATDPDPSLELPDTLHGLVYFPGTINLKPFHRFTDDEFLEDLQVNLMGAVRLLRLAMPALRRTGRASVVLFSTVAVTTGLPFHTSIAAAKGAVEGLARSLAAEWAPEIRVNCIAPSLTDTPLAADLLNADKKREGAAGRHPLNRIGDPEENARLVAFLLGDDSGFMTGQVLRPDGGLSALRLL